MLTSVFKVCKVFLVVALSVVASESPIVNTTYGTVRGKWMTSRNGRVFSAFLGLPFAAPPLGPLRFMPPKPPRNWNGLRDSTKEGDVCIQRVLGGSEDCLYLNVFTHINNINLDGGLPVMVYIHGGGFYGGSSSVDMYGPEYLMDRDIVLVTLQYRLGVFGFLSTEDSSVPGNMGLKDQQRALIWVQENIKLFGGNPQRVTIFGNSAGASSVHLHMLSPSSQNLFAKAISQSGTAGSAFAFIGKGSSRNITSWLAKQLNCATSSSKEMLQCFQLTDSKEIQKVYSDLQDANYEIRKVLYRPVVEVESEDAFLTSSPLQITTHKPWLVGIVGNEGLFKIDMGSLNETIHLIQSEFATYGPQMMYFDDTCSNSTQVSENIYDFYFINITSEKKFITSLEQVISDSWFYHPTLQAVEHHKGTLYCYLFEHNGEHSFTEVRRGPAGYGVSHMDELHYLFSQRQIFPLHMNEIDKNISNLLVNLWVNFAESSNPTPQPISKNPQKEESDTILWEQSGNNEQKFLQIRTNNLEMTSDIFSKRMNFWKWLPIRDKKVTEYDLHNS